MNTNLKIEYLVEKHLEALDLIKSGYKKHGFKISSMVNKSVMAMSPSDQSMFWNMANNARVTA